MKIVLWLVLAVVLAACTTYPVLEPEDMPPPIVEVDPPLVEEDIIEEDTVDDAIVVETMLGQYNSLFIGTISMAINTPGEPTLEEVEEALTTIHATIDMDESEYADGFFFVHLPPGTRQEVMAQGDQLMENFPDLFAWFTLGVVHHVPLPAPLLPANYLRLANDTGYFASNRLLVATLFPTQHVPVSYIAEAAATIGGVLVEPDNVWEFIIQLEDHHTEAELLAMANILITNYPDKMAGVLLDIVYDTTTQGGQ